MKPEDISQGVWDASDVELNWSVSSTDEEVIQLLRVQIARAIMAEREACASIADEYDGDGLTGGHDMHLGDARLTMREIAAAIRNRP